MANSAPSQRTSARHFLAVTGDAAPAITLESVRVPGNVQLPNVGISFFYGRTEIRDLGVFLARQANQNRQRIVSTEVAFDFGDHPMAISRLWIDPEDPVAQENSRGQARSLADQRIVFFDRFTLQLRGVCEDILRESYSRAGVPFVSPFSGTGFLTDRPDLMADLFEHPIFRHVEVFVYRVEAPAYGRWVQIATVTSAASITGLTSLTYSGSITLPDSLPTSRIEPLSVAEMMAYVKTRVQSGTESDANSVVDAIGKPSTTYEDERAVDRISRSQRPEKRQTLRLRHASGGGNTA